MFADPCSANFFEEVHIGKDGRVYLVGLSQFHLDLCNLQCELSPVEVKYHMDYAHLASKLTHGQLLMSASIVKQMVSIVQ